jgi:hypothetical protein
MTATIWNLLYKNMPSANLTPLQYDDIFEEILEFFHLNTIKTYQRTRNILTGKTNKLSCQTPDC